MHKTLSGKLVGSFALAAGIAMTAGMAPASAFTFGIFTPSNAPVGNPAIYNTLPTVKITQADQGSSFNVDWLLPANTSGSPSTALSATGLFTVNSLTSTNLNLTVKLTNTTAASFQAAILATGFSVDPNGTGSFTSTGAVFDGVSAAPGGGQTFPGGFQNTDVCIFAANNCSGGNINQGLQSGGNMDTFTLNIAGNFGTADMPMVTLDSLPIKFQTAQGSFEFPGTPEEHDEVPEPSTTGALGLLGLGVLLAKKKKAQS